MKLFNIAFSFFSIFSVAEQSEEELKMIVGGVDPEEHNVMLSNISPSKFTPDFESCVFEPNIAQKGGAVYNPNGSFTS